MLMNVRAVNKAGEKNIESPWKQVIKTYDRI